MDAPPPPILPHDWTFFGINALNFVTGAAGGLIRGLSRPDHTWARRLTSSVIGAFVSGYGTPVLAPVVASFLTNYGVTEIAVAGLIGMLLGISGIGLCEAVIRRANRAISIDQDKE